MRYMTWFWKFKNHLMNPEQDQEPALAEHILKIFYKHTNLTELFNFDRNVRLGAEYAGLEFWLNSIRWVFVIGKSIWYPTQRNSSRTSCHAPGAPIFVVGTHIDQVYTFFRFLFATRIPDLIDLKVAKYELNQEELKMRYKQIAGFYFVSSHTGAGVVELSQRIVDATLQEKYIGELIPVRRLFTRLVEVLWN